MRPLIPIALLLACGAPHVFASIDPQLLSMVPEDAQVIASIDLSSGRNSEFGRFFINRTQHNDRGLENFVQTTGFDPRRDLQYFLFESSGQTAGQAPGSWSILARGTFDPERLQAHLAQKGASVMNVQGIAVLVDKSKKGKETAICFPDTGIALMGDLATVQHVLFERANPTVLNPALKQQVDLIGAGNDVWFASSAGGSFLGRHFDAETRQAPQAAQALQAVLQSSGGIRFGSNVNLTFDAVTRSPQDANALGDVIHFLAGMAQMAGQKDPRMSVLASLLTNLQLSTTGPNLHLVLAVPEKSIEEFAALQNQSAVHGRGQPAQ